MNESPILILVLQCLYFTGPECTVNQSEICGAKCPQRRQNIREDDLGAQPHPLRLIVTGNGN